MRYYFYCPNCGNEYDATKLPVGTVGNIRDGYGVPVHHYECDKCGNLDAGFMRYGDELGKGWPDYVAQRYYRGVIGMYQGVRGFAQKESDN